MRTRSEQCRLDSADVEPLNTRRTHPYDSPSNHEVASISNPTRQRNADVRSGMSVVIFSPPNGLGEPLDPVRVHPNRLPEGTVIGLILAGATPDADLLARARWFRQGYPRCTQVLLAASEAVLEAQSPSILAASGVPRRVVGLPTPDRLRRAMQVPAAVLRSELLDWLWLVRPRPPETLVQRLADDLDGSRGAARTLARELHRYDLPPPRTWRHLYRACVAAAELQARPERSLAAVALGHGYADQSAMTRRFRSLFDTTPLQVRTALGSAWLLARFEPFAACDAFQKQRVPPARGRQLCDAAGRNLEAHGRQRPRKRSESIKTPGGSGP
jgi:AraC-like DNA-binding protein